MVKLFLVLLAVSFGICTTFSKELCSSYEDEACVFPSTTKNGFYVNQWSVHMPGVPKEEARRILEEELGFVYLGQIINGIDLHLVTKENTFENHAMPNEKIIATLMKNSNVEYTILIFYRKALIDTRRLQVQSVAQKHVIQNSPDEVFSVLDIDKVECQSIDPDTIWLNNGKDNLMRIQSAAEYQASSTEYTARPISSQNESHGDEDEEDEELIL